MKYFFLVFWSSLFHLSFLTAQKDCNDCRIDLYVDANTSSGQSILRKLKQKKGEDGKIEVFIRDFGPADLTINDLQDDKIVIRFWKKKKRNLNTLYRMLNGAGVIKINKYNGKKQPSESIAVLRQGDFIAKKIKEISQPEIPEEFLLKETNATNSSKNQPFISDCNLCGDNLVPYSDEMITKVKIEQLTKIVNNLIGNNRKPCSKLVYCENFFNHKVMELNRSIKKLDYSTKKKIGYTNLIQLKNHYYSNNVASNSSPNQGTNTTSNDREHSSTTQTAIYKLNGELDKLLREMDNFIADQNNKTDAEKKLLTDKAIEQKERIQQFFNGGSSREQEIVGYAELIEKINILRSNSLNNNVSSLSPLPNTSNNQKTAKLNELEHLIDDLKLQIAVLNNDIRKWKNEQSNLLKNLKHIEKIFLNLDTTEFSTEELKKIGYYDLTKKKKLLDTIDLN